MRLARTATYLAALIAVTNAALAGPLITVHTKDGGTFHGELVERVTDDHMTLLLATGMTKRIETKDIDPRPPSPPRTTEPRERAPVETVRTKDGSSYYGAIIESVPDDHVTLTLETGALQVVPWDDIDPTSPPPLPSTREPAPVEKLHTVTGHSYEGDVVEKIVRDHVTIILPSGALRTFKWSEVEWGTGDPRAVGLVGLDFTAGDHVSLERLGGDNEFATICTGPCFTRQPGGAVYRIAGDEIASSQTFVVSAESRIVATARPQNWHTLGVALVVLGSLAATAGLPLATIAVASSSPWQNNTGIDTAATLTNVGGLVSIVAGAVLMAVMQTTVTVNY